MGAKLQLDEIFLLYSKVLGRYSTNFKPGGKHTKDTLHAAGDQLGKMSLSKGQEGLIIYTCCCCFFVALEEYNMKKVCRSMLPLTVDAGSEL